MFLENLLGAAALAVNDRVQEALVAEADFVAQAPAALTLISLRPRQSIRRLAERLRLSHSAAVRLVEALHADGLIERTDDADRRVVRLSLSAKGKALLARIKKARAKRLSALLDGLSATQRKDLQTALERILANATGTFTDAFANCRLCDAPLCEAQGCPVEAKAHAIWAHRKHGAQAEGEPR
jgi:DNA-binding MarR family transcriptional regulator